MSVKIRKWQLSDAKSLSELLNNKKIMDNLRNGLPFPYTEDDARAYLTAMLNAEKYSTFAFAIEYDGQLVGSISVFRQQNVHFIAAEMGYFLE